jgi:hypothetical protein
VLLSLYVENNEENEFLPYLINSLKLLAPLHIPFLRMSVLKMSDNKISTYFVNN